MMTTSFPITCPQCSYRIMKTLGEYETQEDFRCPGCNLLIKVTDITKHSRSASANSDGTCGACSPRSDSRSCICPVAPDPSNLSVIIALLLKENISKGDKHCKEAPYLYNPA